jgi:NAD(P)-dependent dehydrogenase (short-subunit alcohol dehydrogenase family)
MGMNPAIRPLTLDVTSSDSVRAAGRLVREQTGGAGLHGLVNNAGICVSAPLECVPLDEVRAELEVNLIGTVAVTQAFLPLLRMRSAATPPATPAGRIINISSGIGRVAAPFLGVYAASQFAKEGMSDALRRELAPLSVSDRRTRSHHDSDLVQDRGGGATRARHRTRRGRCRVPEEIQRLHRHERQARTREQDASRSGRARR